MYGSLVGRDGTEVASRQEPPTVGPEVRDAKPDVDSQASPRIEQTSPKEVETPAPATAPTEQSRPPDPVPAPKPPEPKPASAKKPTKKREVIPRCPLDVENYIASKWDQDGVACKSGTISVSKEGVIENGPLKGKKAGNVTEKCIYQETCK
jgi:hypothetical protein